MSHDLVTHFQTGALHEDNANDIEPDFLRTGVIETIIEKFSLKATFSYVNCRM